MARKPKIDPRVDADGWFTLDIDQMFQRYMEGNQKTWTHDRKKSVGASEVFGCMRQVFFKKRGEEFGYKPDDDYTERWGATERGNIIEQHFVAPALTTQCPDGVELHYAGDDQITLIEGRTSATPDGLFKGLPRAPLRIIAGGKVIEIADFGADCLGLEIKSIDPRAHLEKERIKHRGQSQVGMGIMREKTKFQPTHWLILYVDASWLDNLKPFIVEYDHNVYLQAKRRAPLIWKYDDPNDFEPEGKYTKECDHCPFKKACGEAVLNEWSKTDSKAKADPEVIAAVADPVEEFLDLQAKLKTVEEEVEIAKQRVKDALISVSSRSVRGEKWSVSWNTQKGSARCDYKRAFAEHNIDPEPYMVQGNPFDVLRVSYKDKGEGHDQ